MHSIVAQETQSSFTSVDEESPYLEVRGVRKCFGHVEALAGLDFAVKRGEVMALVGDNGAGKSTLMKILAGACKADSGQFVMDGKNVKIASPHDATAAGIQIVYQDLALCENLDVPANLFLRYEPVLSGLARIMPRCLRPLNEIVMEKKAREVLDKLQVRTLQSVRTKVGVLSGGQKQTIAIARAVEARSSVILLDEPTAALGVAQTRQVLDVVKTLRSSGHAVVYISHNLRDVFEISDKISVLRLGKRVGVYETKKTSADEIVAAITSGNA